MSSTHTSKFKLRTMGYADLPFCSRLVAQAGWNQIDNDWIRLMDLDPNGCYIAEQDGINVGSIVFTRFGQVAWVSMVLVDISWRGKGIGQRMFGQAIQTLQSSSIKTIRLDATNMGVNLYRKYGFKEDFGLIRLVRDKGEGDAKSEGGIKRANLIEIKKMSRLDSRISGTDRIDLIRHLLEEDAAKMYVNQVSSDEITGYIGMRKGRTGWQIGPCMATDELSGIALLDTALSHTSGTKVIIDVPSENKTVLDWARVHHFIEERRFIRMHAGQKPEDNPEHIFASFGPEKG